MDKKLLEVIPVLFGEEGTHWVNYWVDPEHIAIYERISWLGGVSLSTYLEDW